MSNLLNVGRITTVYGVKGWIKVHSQTEPAENLFHYQPWYLKTKHGIKAVDLVDWRSHGKGFIAQIKDIDNRAVAEQLCPVDIAIEKSQLAVLPDGDYYWHQLEGLRVISEFDGQRYDFGLVKKILPTGANDVLVVVGDAQSLDQDERLIPYIPGQFVKSVNVIDGTIYVEWDPEF
ncbi:ribosome maturation factor RimM [Candidatus Endobugula sertula]|uniref:Ribosome maturation factor RimM n=1 Tax=Candidatus Endobugula sertula TaxID=62101 RepID=A0A1D2QS95_9GAMM|nr:ribosome maturation factor RimM [Candidatus Endobugula sertula]